MPLLPNSYSPEPQFPHLYNWRPLYNCTIWRLLGAAGGGGLWIRLHNIYSTGFSRYLEKTKNNREMNSFSSCPLTSVNAQLSISTAFGSHAHSHRLRTASPRALKVKKKSLRLLSKNRNKYSVNRWNLGQRENGVNQLFIELLRNPLKY